MKPETRKRAGALLAGAFSLFLFFNAIAPHVDGWITENIEYRNNLVILIPISLIPLCLGFKLFGFARRLWIESEPPQSTDRER